MDEVPNRMATTKRRGGRPTNAELDKRPPFKVAEHEELPAVMGVRCLGCGRAQVPRILRTEGRKRRIACSMCGRLHDAIYDDKGVARIRLAD